MTEFSAFSKQLFLRVFELFDQKHIFYIGGIFQP
jgi:hypothetical protein